MPRSVAAYLADIIDACDAIDRVLEGIDVRANVAKRSIRSSVEREFIIIGEAVAGIRRTAPELVERITDARVIVGLRNVLTHEYAAVDDEAVYGVATEDLELLRRECSDLLERVEGAG
jgi:uncharacterized protein with HEPN domain